MKKPFRLVAATAACTVVAASGCSSASDEDGVTIQWWTWDDKQAVSWEQCVPAFEEANPGVQVEISQYAWDDYWTKLTAGFVAGNAPDTFMDHMNNYPEYTSQGQLLPLDDYIEQTGYDIDQIAVGIDTWTYTDGSLYGIPKDWATVAFYYNADMLADAGLTVDDVMNMTWNPEDGGTFEDVIARLTVDENGVRGDEPGFDAENVAVYGINSLGSGGVNGQDTWANFASTTGWTLGDEENWPTTLQYSDPRYVATAEYLRGLAERGLTPEDGEFTLGQVEQLGSGSAAIVQSGSWNATSFFGTEGLNVGIAPSVIGPEGERRGLSNSNADSIWAGTEHPDEAFAWISYMNSPECQDVAGADGTFFPSISSSMEVTSEALSAQGIDVSPFTDQFEAGTLFESPAFGRGEEVGAAVGPLSEAYFLFERDADVFEEMDELSREILAQ
ncbi:ABC transporter substrate-binding protein [Glycomyces harbinensis]|uniref:Multiple sugar transport system substrate-binding protein n=1 Tax=Glycomyces harbinensis TaxID=58114 RepID=A0A1G6XCE4_9ACTN|nr:sugar ABC transporter substrate-binding protein [Glycomyces harbinensis]SDD74965.1 multiple sugar transport system substrate-binding protein [Glycomyces harbinensis]